MLEFTYKTVVENSKSFSKQTSDDKDFNDFKNKCNPLDLSKKEHIDELLNWLRKWGCRSLSKKCTQTSIDGISIWYKTNQKLINNFRCSLHETDLDILQKDILRIYDTLSNTQCAFRKNVVVHFGNVVASKILFAINPQFFVPWDRRMIKALKSEFNVYSYYDYLCLVKKNILVLKQNCKINGINFDEFFKKIENDGFARKHNSYAKLIEEIFYFNLK